MNTKLLSDISFSLSKVNDIDDLLSRTYHYLSESGQYSLCFIGTLNIDSNQFEAIPDCDATRHYFNELNIELFRSLHEYRFKSDDIFNIGKYFVNNDIWKDLLFKNRGIVIPEEFNSVAVFPLIKNLKIIGALFLYSDKKGFFKHDELLLLQILSIYLSLALDNLEFSQNTNEVQTHAKELNKISSRKRGEASMEKKMTHNLRSSLNFISGFITLI